MNYSLNYNILSINYNERTRVTSVQIVCEDTGEIFEGHARRNPSDKMNIALAVNLSTMRAVRKAMLEDLRFAEQHILEYGSEFSFEN